MRARPLVTREGNIGGGEVGGADSVVDVIVGQLCSYVGRRVDEGEVQIGEEEDWLQELGGEELKRRSWRSRHYEDIAAWWEGNARLKAVRKDGVGRAA